MKFEDFYEEVYEELSKFGRIEEMHVCDNLGDHLVGNVYAKFSDEEEADAALKGLYGRWYVNLCSWLSFDGPFEKKKKIVSH